MYNIVGGYYILNLDEEDVFSNIKELIETETKPILVKGLSKFSTTDHFTTISDIKSVTDTDGEVIEYDLPAGEVSYDASTGQHFQKIAKIYPTIFTIEEVDISGLKYEVLDLNDRKGLFYRIRNLIGVKSSILVKSAEGDYFTNENSIEHVYSNNTLSTFVIPLSDWKHEAESTTYSGEVIIERYTRDVARVTKDNIIYTSQAIADSEVVKNDYCVIIPDTLNDTFYANTYDLKEKSERGLTTENQSYDYAILVRLCDTSYNNYNNEYIYVNVNGSGIVKLKDDYYYYKNQSNTTFNGSLTFTKINISQNVETTNIYNTEIELTETNGYMDVFLEYGMNIINFKFLDKRYKTIDMSMDDVYNYNQIMWYIPQETEVKYLEQVFRIGLVARDIIGERQSGDYQIRVQGQTTTNAVTPEGKQKVQVKMEFILEEEN